jgi:DNA transformation protein
MPQRPAFVDFVIERFSPAGDITARFMMGGWCLYCDGLVFALVADNELYLKGGSHNIPAFEARGLKPFRPFPDQDMVMKYFQAPPEVFEDPEAMLHWVSGAVEASRQKASRKRPAGKPAGSQEKPRKRVTRK